MASEARTPVEVLSDAIRMEMEGKDFFERASGRMSVPRARDMFLGLVKQEQRHVDVLTNQLRSLKDHNGWVSVGELPDHGPERSAASVFGDKDLKKIVLRPDAGELEVLKLGIEVERKSIEYYRSAGDASEDPKAKEVFAWLVEEEKGHLVILRAEYDSRARSGFYYDSAEFSLEVE